MEEWEELADTVPRTLLRVATDTTTGLLATVASTHAKLAASVHLLGRFRAGLTRHDIGGDTRAPLTGGFPSADLDGAFRELARLGALHARAGHAFVLYGEQLGLHQGGAAASHHSHWDSWQERRADALDHAADALRRLRAAVSHARAMEDATRLAKSFPRGSPDWHAWMSAAMKLAPHAIVGTAMALLALRRMRDAVGREFCAASMVLGLGRNNA